MRDGLTHELDRPSTGSSSFLQRHAVKIVVVSGRAVGTEIALDQSRTVLGRGPGVDVTVDDTTMSRQHAVIELDGETLRIRDLGSKNGMSVNRELTAECALTHGDRFKIGSHEFQIIIEERVEEPETYVLPTDA
jgi:pSer/pThr/pTyr-binding forkhead associated (FHA) protein